MRLIHMDRSEATLARITSGSFLAIQLIHGLGDNGERILLADEGIIMFVSACSGKLLCATCLTDFVSCPRARPTRFVSRGRLGVRETTR